MSGFANVFVCSACVPGALGGHKRAPMLLKLDLEMLVGCHMGAENRTQVSTRAVKLLTSEPSLLCWGYLFEVSVFCCQMCMPLAAEKALRIN